MRSCLALTLSLFMCIPVSGKEAASAPPVIEGTWISEGRKFVITKAGSGWKVHGWGKCSPTQCDWGEVNLSLIAPSVDSREYTHAVAVWNVGFATTFAVFKLDGQARMPLELFTVFNDGSNRSNWRLFLSLERGM